MITTETWKRLYHIATTQDKKTNVEMAAKLGEEYGELLREVLIHAGADGTQYRGTPVRDQLLEEVADVFICIAAVAARYEVSAQEFEEWVNKKADKWEKVIAKEPHSVRNYSISYSIPEDRLQQAQFVFLCNEYSEIYAKGNTEDSADLLAYIAHLAKGLAEAGHYE